MNFRQGSSEPSELVIGIIGPIGCNRSHVVETIKQLAHHYSYKAEKISVSALIEENAHIAPHDDDQYARVSNLMVGGNELRWRTKDNAILAKLAAEKISKSRKKNKLRNIYLIDSIKHPEEVDEFRNIYGSAFYLIALHSSEEQREQYLKNQCHILDNAKVTELIERDRGESFKHGQSTSEAFHRADFFLNEDGSDTKMWNTLERFLDVIFGDPFQTPTFHEYAMYLAYGASMRSADMSRQVGAILTDGTEILALGANECPSPGGGTYWPQYNRDTGEIFDTPAGRDYMNGFDRNAHEKADIIQHLTEGFSGDELSKLKNNIAASGVEDITEFGRVVHAEMDALLTCARRGISTLGATLFCTTFPCHNCAKHIITSGVKKVLYIEPYPKSKALQMHPDSIASKGAAADRVHFSPFVGVGPRQFVDLFSMTLSSGARIKRKSSDGLNRSEWVREKALPRVKTLPVSYFDNEGSVSAEARKRIAAIVPFSVRSGVAEDLVPKPKTRPAARRPAVPSRAPRSRGS